MTTPTQTQSQGNAKRSRAEAATLAAATFAPNRKSLFDSARVTGAALKQALRDAAQRIVLSTPGIAATSQVSVVFAGEGAYVSHEWRSVNKARELIVTAAIFLPDVDDLANVPRALADEMLAMMLHELAHAFFTNADAFRTGIHTLAQKHGIDIAQAKDLINSVEDVRIERALMASGYASGFRGIVGTLTGRMMADAVQAGCLKAFAAGDSTALGFAVAFGLRATPAGAHYVPGAEVIAPALAPRLRAVYDMVAANVYSIPADHKGTAGAVAIADRALSMLKLTRQQTGEQGDKGDGQGEQEGDGAPQPGDGEQGEQGEQDGPQSGQNGPQGDAGEPGEGEAGDKAESDATGDASGDGAAGSDEGDSDAGGESSGLPTGASATDGTPPPGTFSSEPRIMAIPDACKPTTESALFNPRIRPPFPVTEEGMRRGTAALAEANARTVGKSGALVAHLRRMFSKSDRDALETGKRHGRIRVGALSRVVAGAENVFARRELTDGAAAACAVLIDGSGSMQRLAQTANAAALLLVQALAKCPGVKTQVQVFQDGGGNSMLDAQIAQGAHELGMRTRNADFDLRTFKDYDDNAATAYSNATPTAGGSTPDLEALRYVGRALAKRAEPRKVLLVMVDGGTNRIDAIRAECKHLERMGVAVVALGLGGYDGRGFTHAVPVADLSDLAGAAMRQACEAIARQGGAS